MLAGAKAFVGSEACEAVAREINQSEGASGLDPGEGARGERGYRYNANPGRPCEGLDEGSVRIAGEIAYTELAGRRVETIVACRAKE
jgi:hypothetical protein